DLPYKTVCINLERRSDRKTEMIKLFDLHHITNYEFYKAIDGSTLEPTKEIYNLFKDNDFGYRRGMIGCALSHYNIWNQLLNDTDNDFYLIFEDDINVLDTNYMNRINQILDTDGVGKADFIILGYTMFDTDRAKYADL